MSTVLDGVISVVPPGSSYVAVAVLLIVVPAAVPAASAAVVEMPNAIATAIEATARGRAFRNLCGNKQWTITGTHSHRRFR